MSKNTVDPDSLQMTVWRMRIEFWITNVIDTHSEYVILIAFPLQQLLHHRASLLRYTHIVSLVSSQSSFSRLPSTWMTSLNSAVRHISTVNEVESQSTE
jgi:predicted proteasome-type protease